MRYKKIVITGKVQGVGFREFLRRQASVIGGLAGYARNLKSGEVEVLVAGEEEKIKKLVEKCRQGPLLSSVKGILVEDVDLDDEYDNFFVKL